MKPAAKQQRRVFAVPAVIAAVSLAGLIVGLVGEGLEDAICWLALASCLGIIAWAVGRAASNP